MTRIPGSGASQRHASVGMVLPGLSRVAVGGYKVVYGYANALDGLGHDVTVYHSPVLEGWPHQTPSLRESASDRLHHRTWLRTRPSWCRLAPTVRVRNSYALSASALRGHDILVATSAETAPLVALAAANEGAAGAYFIQHFEHWAGEADVLATWDLPLRHIVIAPWLQRISASHGQQALLVPNAIDTTEFPLGGPVRSRDVDVVALVSDKQFKRTDLVVRILNSLSESRPGFRASTFGTVGRPDGLNLAIDHHVSPTPAHLRRLYQASRIYLCTSDAEGWHLPPAEAMASGCAVVSTAIPGVEAYAEDVALFAPRGDTFTLQRQIESLIEDPTECQRRASLGSSRMRNYSPADAACSFEQALLTALGER